MSEGERGGIDPSIHRVFQEGGQTLWEARKPGHLRGPGRLRAAPKMAKMPKVAKFLSIRILATFVGIFGRWASSATARGIIQGGQGGHLVPARGNVAAFEKTSVSGRIGVWPARWRGRGLSGGGRATLTSPPGMGEPRPKGPGFADARIIAGN